MARFIVDWNSSARGTLVVEAETWQDAEEKVYAMDEDTLNATRSDFEANAYPVQEKRK